MRTIIRLASIVLLLGIGAGNAWGTVTTYTFNSASWGATSGGSDANWTSGSGGNAFVAGQGVQVTTGKTGANATSPVSFSNVSQIVVTYNTNKSAGNGTIKVQIGSNDVVSTAVQYHSVENGTTADFQTTFRFEPRQSGSIKLTTDVTTNSIWIKEIEITHFNNASAYTIKFDAGGGTYAGSDLTESSANAGITLPTATPSSGSASEGWGFYGWATVAKNSSPESAPTIVGKSGDKYYPTSSHTLYAVYAVGEYTKITSSGDLTAGGNYLIAANSGGHNYIMSNTYAPVAGWGALDGILIDETNTTTHKYSAASVDANYVFTMVTASSLSVATGDWMVKNVVDEYYISADYMDFYLDIEGNEPDGNTVSVTSGTWTIVNVFNSSANKVYFDDTDLAFKATTSTATDLLIYKETTASRYSSSPSFVTLSQGTVVNADIIIDPENAPTYSSTDADRQVTIMVQPSDGYEINPAGKLTFTKTSGTATATYISGPTDNGDGTYNYVYQFALGDNGTGTFGLTAGHLTFYRTACYREFDGNAAAGDKTVWSNTGNWTGNRLPTIQERADILKPVTVDIPDAKAKNVVLKKNSGNTGSLEIQAGKALTVAETVRKTTDGSNRIATNENDIVFGSTLADGTGALVMNGYTSGDNKATVNFAVKAKNDGGWVNQFIGTPFNDQGAVLYNYYGTQLYAFHPAKDGSYDSGTSSEYDAWWSRLSEEEGMDPFVGYNILCSKAESPVLWMQGTLNASSNVTLSSLAGGASVENLLANSWMAPIHIDQFQSSDFTNVEQTIYIFNAGTPNQYVAPGSGSASAEAPGTYIVLPIASAPWVSPTITVIPAMQAFSVYANDASPSLTLDYNRLVYTPALTDVGVVPTRAPRRARAAESAAAPEVIRLRVAAESGYAANAYILGREDFNEGFDDGWDGRFMEGDYAAPQLYAPTENGNMVINCVPEIEGTVLCFKPGTADNDYTFSFGYEGEESWYLNDQKEQESTLISALDSYTFHSSADDMPARFVVSRTPIYKTPTGVEDADVRNQKSDVRKIVIDDHVFIIRNGLMYDVTGALCK